MQLAADLSWKQIAETKFLNSRAPAHLISRLCLLTKRILEICPDNRACSLISTLSSHAIGGLANKTDEEGNDARYWKMIGRRRISEETASSWKIHLKLENFWAFFLSFPFVCFLVCFSHSALMSTEGPGGPLINEKVAPTWHFPQSEPLTYPQWFWCACWVSPPAHC